MTPRAIRVFWGRRPESVQAVASRWRRTLEQVEFLLPEVVGGSWQQIHSAGPATAVTVDQLAQVLEKAQAAEDWSDRLGIGLRLVASGGPEWGLELSGLAGGEPEIVLQSMILAVSAPDAAEVPETELLRMLAAVWEPDFGDVTDDDILDALEDESDYRVGDPVIGRFGYLSAARADAIPDDLAVDVTALPGGVLLQIGAVDGVVRAYERLRETGALDPLPRPLDRAVL
ncbi:MULTISPECIES: hypothetical protein [unclassified Rhodococcus (in: high G+C Gram-positive bacteria)]|uniref:hypothetical protein n=1 Tax=unclassified Rhodococcus (in: high G+C Gram-positive bacteria) TaxID=192944 RepID=UPI0024B873A6|nr:MULTISPECIES: hypothetical protein [unclassified Rhodococcus (in: high G+C Gram-positive bacteria)]MDI9958432.1 hypothetical protein [Rhodococcus sp. IEGM 1237]MDI9964414.1 hypothetical protein [Rhodococcus sp. IEGM 1251]MDV8126649.1 hypothetical protein [Rhodococcus sp. IEGM 1304]